MTLSPTDVAPGTLPGLERRPGAATARVLPFRTDARRFRRVAPDESARILLFTGVRYERMPEPMEAAEPVAPRRRRRS